MHTERSLYLSFRAVFAKEVLLEFRNRYALSVLLMFAVMTFAGISISIGAQPLSSALSAAHLWVVLFFSAMAGLARTFIQEQDANTLMTLRVYAEPQAVLFGKMAFNIILLTGLSILVVSLFIAFFNIEVKLWFWLITVLSLGVVGMAVVTTIMAAIAAQSRNRSSLLTVLTFPILLPQFLTAIAATAAIFSGVLPDASVLIFLGGYDIVTVLAVSILFDYLWH